MLDDILLPDTSPRIAHAYHELAERAKTEDFGLLEDDVVVLDTETTGLSFKTCRLTEIAAARLHGRTIVDRFQTFVNPHMSIPDMISQLTHITNADVADAPDAESAVADLAAFVGGDPVLAHNAAFDKTFIEHVSGGRDVSDNWIDTLALSRIALPRLSTHRLQDMAEAFECARVSHRAMDDVDALADMWRIILCGLTDLPAGLLEHLANMHPDVAWAYRPILSHLALATPGTPFSLVGIRRDLVGTHHVRPRPDSHEGETIMYAPESGEVADAFSEDGIVSSMYDAYEPRPQQAHMAEEVRRAIETSTMSVIEAGTGVGKSVAYLLPLALYARRNGVTCGVATKTNALTDQLVSHELPQLARALPGGLTYHSLKGYDHYPCLRRLNRAAEADLPLDDAPSGSRRSRATIASDMLTALATTYAFVSQSVEGDLDALGIRWSSVPRELLTIHAGECTHSRCPFYPNLCLLHGARRRAGLSDIVVTNHSLLLRNIDADNCILPPIRTWVVDEAHSFEAEARRQWALEVSAERVRSALEQLGGTRSGAIHTFSSLASQQEAALPALGLLAKAASSAQRFSVVSADFFDAVRGLIHLGKGSGYENVTVWLGTDARESDIWQEVVSRGEDFVTRLDDCLHDLEDAQRICVEAIENLPSDLEDLIRVFEQARDACKLIIDGTDDTYVYSVELSRAQRRRGFERLVAEKIDVGTELAQRWYPDMQSVIYTSATLTVGEDFSHFTHAVGLDLLPAEMHHEISLESFYDFDDHMCVCVARDMPDPYDQNYLSSLDQLLYDVHTALGGSVLTLFTNRREMEQVYAGLAPRLAEAGLDVVMQERTSSARQLRKRFIEEESLSLLALRSFWEGFDAAGDTLRCVVIPKLPFSSPNDPLSQERGARDRQAWRHWSLPEAVLTVKQAAGRLIRTSTDTGVLVLADARLTTKGYGKIFLRSLPSNNIVNLGIDTMGTYLETWNKRKKD